MASAVGNMVLGGRGSAWRFSVGITGTGNGNRKAIWLRVANWLADTEHKPENGLGYKGEAHNVRTQGSMEMKGNAAL